MCFSATASFVAGTALTGVGVATVKKIKTKKEILFGSIPFLFGIQQITEGFVWLSFQYGLTLVNQIATYSFVLFAYVVWPIFVPLSVRIMETDLFRRRLLVTLHVVGLMVGLYLLSYIIQTPILSEVVHNSIAYTEPKEYGTVILFFYVLATCVSCLVSSHRIINLLGVLTILSLGIAYYFYATSYASVWCFFAAVLSLVVYREFSRD